MLRFALLATVVAATAGCGGGQSSGQGETTNPSPECGTFGTPVSLNELVRIMRANGITLDVNQRRCDGREPTDPDATNAGPSALEVDETVDRREGSVLCDVGSKGADRTTVTVTKYPTDVESHLRALNVLCTIYPYDAASEAAQIARLKSALEALVREKAPS